MNSTLSKFQRNTINVIMKSFAFGVVLGNIIMICLKLFNVYDNFELFKLEIYIAVSIIELLILFILHKKIKSNKNFIDDNYNNIGFMFVIIAYINCITFNYTIPSNEFCLAIPYFMTFTCLFLNKKIITVSAIFAFISEVILLILKPSLIPLGENLIIDMILKVTVILLNISGIYLLSVTAANLLEKSSNSEDKLIKNNDKMTNLFNQIKNISNTLVISSKDLTTASETSANALQEISASCYNINQSSDSVMEDTKKNKEILQDLLYSSNQTSDKVVKTGNFSKELVSIFNKNEESLNEILSIIYSIKEGTTKTFDSTKFLKNKSNEIDQIIAVIANVSEQTNLLSLNASIEAARAGEAGKGFAVVANEIRTLSDNTNKSLQNIAKIINDFKSSILDVENLMLNNNTNITGGVRILTDIVEELKTNINNLNNVNTDVNEITIFINKLLKEIDTVVNLNEKISNGTELIVDEFKTVTVAIENNTAVSEELNTSAEELNDIATNMSKLID
ncbi:hypothetical protein K144316041_06610 [Clostridium tetani]|uniref:Chemotaxis protein n=1 Tax=Clostridium tetani TaxID=1513 RepID=A0A4Q0VGN1_CLOTA|nr:methyl-accepting chemotaxis protein [Clostridium tetani]RXI50447.1 chemotaxis protein [Clostridium tetani]BDR66452.1 hypothetical protein K144312032_06800 [Clostridium tetani]BDR71953.1 hypothetical protein K144316041_06610 [Clostridium tetani]BDR80428.1 hypothetical protein K234311028_06740 [Clostridium tetani]BDR88883.1 hypothetical protein N072000002_06840 [Clostridium tetani]